jgi:hypothetical protein
MLRAELVEMFVVCLHKLLTILVFKAKAKWRFPLVANIHYSITQKAPGKQLHIFRRFTIRQNLMGLNNVIVASSHRFIRLLSEYLLQ